MPAAFKDHFSERSDNYARYRPTYPSRLFEYLAGIAPAGWSAWDCGTGSGQTAVALARHFGKVFASDASSAQIDATIAHPKVDYRVASAEASGLDDNCVDLVTVSQAFHWFEADRFVAEAARVLRPNGVLAIWCYASCSVLPRCDAIVEQLYTDLIGPYWPPERALIEEGYASVKLPGDEIDAPCFEMSLSWTVQDMLGYLRTWSACRRYRAAKADDPVSVIESDLVSAWGPDERTVSWPLHTRISRLNTVD